MWIIKCTFVKVRIITNYICTGPCLYNVILCAIFILIKLCIILYTQYNNLYSNQTSYTCHQM